MSFVPFLACEASAGSGKTFALSVRYVSLLLKGAHPNQILALTFTNKAAKEMRQKITHLLKNLASSQAQLKELEKILDKPQEDIIRSSEKIHALFVRSNPKIYTIDKFFGFILKRFSLNLGLLPTYRIGSPHTETFVQKFLSVAMQKKLLLDLVDFVSLSKMGLSHIFELFEDMRTRNLISNAKPQSVSLGVATNEVLAITKKMQELIFNNPDASDLAKKAIGHKNIFDVLSKTWLERDTLEYRTFSSCYTLDLDELFFALKKKIKLYFDVKESLLFAKMMEFFDVYEEVLKNHNKAYDELSFNDVSRFVYEILHSQDRDFVYFRLDSRIEHILIDEFQDTSKTQIDILQGLIEEIVSGQGTKDNKSFFAVGDTKQSIYRFRGGKSELFSKLIKDFRLDTTHLDTNYRSDKKIIDFTNDVFAKLYGDKFIEAKSNSRENGYVEVVQTLDKIQKVIDIITDLRARNMTSMSVAVLVFKNNDVLEVAQAIKQNFKDQKIVTDTTKLLINDAYPRAIIEFIRYIYTQEQLAIENFKALVGLDLNENLSLDPQEFMHKSPLLIAKTLCQTYGLNSANVTKFLSIISGYDDIFSFMQAIENDRTSIDAGDEQGINILTIHKSKGLQFDCVIVVDSFSRARPQINTIIEYEYRLYYRMAARQWVCDEYKRAYDHEADLGVKDKINLQYVAMTRAKHELYIVQNEKDSSFLNISNQTRGEKTFVAKKETQATQELKPIEPFVLGKQEVQQVLDEDDAINPDFGNAVHFALEMMEDFTLQCLEQSMHLVQNHYGEIIDVKKVEDVISKLLSHKPFLDILNEQNYKEQMISFDSKIYIIDLLIYKDGVYYICDYKTSKPHPSHEKQVKQYIEAIRKIKQTQNVVGRIIYLGEQISIREITWE